MKTNQARYNRISILFSLTALLLFTSIGKAQLKVLSSGNVGVGSSSPPAKFTVVGSESRFGGVGSGYISVYNATTRSGYLQANSGQDFRIASESDPMTFWTNGGEKARILTNGFFGIGTTSPGTKLHVVGNGNTFRLQGADHTFIEFYPDGVTTRKAYFGFAAAADNNLTMVNEISGAHIILSPTGTGKVGIGTTTPGYQLELSLNSAGKPTSSTWSVTSDLRTKTNIETYVHGLDLVRQVKLVSYQYNGVAHTPAGENGIGVIAQAFQEIFPNSVKPFAEDSTGTNEPFLGVDFHELFIANVGAVKQLDSIVGTQDSVLWSKIESLTMIVSKQDSINASLQKQVNQLLTTMTNCCALNEGRSMQSLTNPSSQTSIKQTDVKLTDAQTIVLEQNIPNPFAEQTAINYSLPDNTVKAQMLFYNAQGKLIQSTELTQKGKGTLNVFASDLSSGIYTYTLVIDGKIIETKKMVKQ